MKITTIILYTKLIIINRLVILELFCNILKILLLYFEEKYPDLSYIYALWPLDSRDYFLKEGT